MFERIIVALDGSPSSEAALPPARELARRLGSAIVLLHVVEARPPKAVHGERHLATSAEAAAYLAALAEALVAAGVPAEYHVHEPGPEDKAAGDREVAETVAEHQSELSAGLAVMAAHGRHGLSGALSGSLPLKVAAASGASVLLVSPAEGPRDSALSPKRVVVPLDGRPEHEAALPGALALAAAFGASVLLVTAVPRSAAQAGGPGSAFGLLAPALSRASLDYALEGSELYLRGVADRARAAGAAVESLVVRGRPAKSIVAACRAGDLLALSTHRKLGLDARLDGSVAFEAARRWRGPMLVAPVARST